MNLVPWKRKEAGGLSLQKEMNRLFDHFFQGFDMDPFRGAWNPALDVHETDEHVVVQAEVPGVPSENLDVSLSGNLLTIKGEKKDEREEKGDNWHKVERTFGSFQRSVTLPDYVDPSSVEAASKDGVLTLHIGKKKEARPKRIDIKVE